MLYVILTNNTLYLPFKLILFSAHRKAHASGYAMVWKYNTLAYRFIGPKSCLLSKYFC